MNTDYQLLQDLQKCVFVTILHTKGGQKYLKKDVKPNPNPR